MTGVELGILIGSGAALAAYVGAVFKKVYGQKRAIERAAAPVNPAIEPVSMKQIREDPEAWLPKLRGKVSSVHVVSAPRHTAGDDGGTVHPHFVSFLIDENGEAHDLDERDVDWPLEEDAQWLAAQLGARYDRG